jgi:hypothetical protein
MISRRWASPLPSAIDLNTTGFFHLEPTSTSSNWGNSREEDAYLVLSKIELRQVRASCPGRFHSKTFAVATMFHDQ